MASNDSKYVKIYLLLYNFVQFFGWSYSLVVVLSFAINKGTFKDVYLEVQSSLLIFQTLMLLDVVHCLTGIVSSNTINTLMQVLVRQYFVWGILQPFSETRNSIGFPILLIAWSSAEITRYLYYALNIYNMAPNLLVWMRYTFFIVLFPMGFFGELLVLVSAYHYVRDNNLYAIELPNFVNISLYYHHLLLILFGPSLIFFVRLYFYMLAQRKKILGTKPINRCKND